MFSIAQSPYLVKRFLPDTKAELDAFIVMPNHIHGIILLRDPVRAGLKPALTMDGAPGFASPPQA
jgi:hypothetical protein